MSSDPRPSRTTANECEAKYSVNSQFRKIELNDSCQAQEEASASSPEFYYNISSKCLRGISRVKIFVLYYYILLHINGKLSLTTIKQHPININPIIAARYLEQFNEYK